MDNSVGVLERLTIEAVAAAPWILDTDRPKVAAVLIAAREVDRVVRVRAGQADDSHDDASIDGTLVYASDVLGRMLDSLGLSPVGRKNLSIEPLEEEPDELAIAIALLGNRSHGISDASDLDTS